MCFRLYLMKRHSWHRFLSFYFRTYVWKNINKMNPLLLPQESPGPYKWISSLLSTLISPASTSQTRKVFRHWFFLSLNNCPISDSINFQIFPTNTIQIQIVKGKYLCIYYIVHIKCLLHIFEEWKQSQEIRIDFIIL